ncbi:hypothetical protein AOLI_G00198700 [Acnodon oligacanthus]
MVSSSCTCTGVLAKPTISLSTFMRPSRGLQRSEAFRGHSFAITCSTQPQYPGGSFHLKLPWNNRSHTQTAVNHSASFLFPAADDSHQGKYSCVYENEVNFREDQLQDEWALSLSTFTHNFSSESDHLSISVNGQQGAAAAAVQYESIELVSLQSRAEEQKNVERGAGEELLTDLEQEEEEAQDRN